MKRGGPELPSLADIIAFNNSSAELRCDQIARVSILSNFTADGIEPFLVYQCLKNGIRPTIAFGGYDTVLQDLIEMSGGGHSDQPEIIVFSIILEQLDPAYIELEWNSALAQKRLLALFQTAAEKTNALLVVNTFIPPYDADYGIATGTELTERGAEVSAINRAIRDFVRQNHQRFFLVDWERLARICGEHETMDYRFWYMSKAPFKQPFLNQYALEILKVVRALKGKAKKCLLLDCDNTLWGGVVGEDGISGIKLDPHSYPGSVYYDFQRQVLHLYGRGVILALVSKNNEEDVLEVLERHPHCLIKREHLAMWRVNWNEKTENIQSIAEELNLGTDSLVFVDDSPLECDLVGAMLPDVEVCQVPDKLYLLPRLLSRDGLFDTLAVSSEDRNRSAMYRVEAVRKQAERAFGSVEDYLATLGLELTICQAGKEDMARIAQLTQKTNQFNLTTRRYSAAQIEAFSQSGTAAVFSLNVRDRFGDFGLTGVLIAFLDGGVGRIDSFQLSCRVLGRGLETVFLNHCLDRLEERWNVSEWFAEYIPSRKNGQTANFYANAGFVAIRSDAAGTTFRCEAGTRATSPISYITVKEGTDAELS